MSESRRVQKTFAGGFSPFIVGSLLVLFLPLVVFSFLPIIEGLRLSFFGQSMTAHTFVGLENYRNLLEDRVFRISLVNTFKFVLIVVPMNLILSLPIAIGLNSVERFKGALRAAYFLPTVTSIVAVSIVWIYLYNPFTGLVNMIVEFFGLSPHAWLSEPQWALPAIAVMWVWRDLGYNIIVFLAGLQGIPEVFYEAASIDGAKGWQLFRYITYPLLRPVFQFVITMTALSAFKVFAPMQVMTGGGPARATTILVLYVYENAFEYLKMGIASAASVVLFGIILIITWLQLTHFSTDWDY